MNPDDEMCVCGHDRDEHEEEANCRHYYAGRGYCCSCPNFVVQK